MNERIFQYLAKSDKALSADRILREVLKLDSPDCLTAHRVLKGILAKDRRFHHTRAGLWWVSRGSFEQIIDLDSAAVLFLEGTRAPERFVRGALYVPQTSTQKEFIMSGLASSTDRDLLRLARDEADLHLLCTWSPADLVLWNWLLRYEQLPEWDGQTLSLGALAARVLPSLPTKLCPADLASRLDLPAPDEERPAAMARYLGGCLTQLMQRVPEGYRAAEQLQQWIAAGEPKVDFGRFSFGPDFLRNLPESPGVYIMRRSGGEPIYVGKARNLRRRVRSYFTPQAARNPKVARLHDQLDAIEYLETSSEVEALLLEVQLIRELRPAVNLKVEVHVRPGYYGKTRNLILLVRNEKNAQAQLYFLREGSFVARVAARPGKKLTKKLREWVRSVYFKGSSRKTQEREPWEMEIVSTWLRSHWGRLNLLDVDEAGSCDTVLKRLEEFLRDPDLFKNKVYHR